MNDKVMKIKSVDEYSFLLTQINKEEYYFRGYCKYNQRYSTLFRDKLSDGISFDILFGKSNINAKFDNELEYIRKFEDVESQWMQDFNNPIDMVATAQHLGLKTRFKDWSTSILIATLFSLRFEGQNEYYLMVKNSRQFIKVKTLPYENVGRSLKNVIKYKGQIELYKKICSARNELWKSNVAYLQQYIKDIKEKKKNYFDIINLIHKNFANNQNWNCIYNYFSNVFEETSPIKRLSFIKKYSVWFLYGEKILIESKISNDKIANQKGLFELEDYDYFYELNPCKELKELYEENDDETKLIIIDGKIRNEIIMYISKLGITYNDLMRNADETTRLINDVIDHKLPKYL